MSRFLLSEHEQGSDGWRAARAGKATGSKADCIDAKSRDGKSEGNTRRDYRVQLVTERLTGCPVEEGFTSKDIQWGKDNEHDARMAYEQATGEIVREAGFAYLPETAAGCSVDGFIGDRGILELKCPKSHTHLAYMQAKRLPPDYADQVAHNLWITGCEFADFVSFDPRFPDYLQLFTVRVYRSELKIDAHEAAVFRFLGEVDVLEARLRARRPVALAA